MIFNFLHRCSLYFVVLSRNAKERNGRFVDNTSTAQFDSRSRNNHNSFPTQPPKQTRSLENEDFQAWLNEDDDFLAQLDEPMVNPEELNGHQDELDDDINHLLNSEDDIPEEMLNDL